MHAPTKRWQRWTIRITVAVGLVALLAVSTVQVLKGSVLRGLNNGKLVAADYWTSRPEILSGGYGFDNIIGLPQIDKQTVQDAGGSWYGSLECTNGEEPTAAQHTSAAIAETIPQGYKGYADYDDGLPVVFSWPVATETMDPTDFRFTLNTGRHVFGHAAGMNPNWENDERNTVVLFGDFGNRKRAAEPGAVFPTELEIVDDGSPLMLVGPGGREVSAVGLRWTTDQSPYDSGPKLVGAKLNAVGTEAKGEGGVTLIEKSGALPNDEFSLYGNRGDYRLRVLTSGGFSPDGVTGLQPDDFEDFFRLRVRNADGTTTLIERQGVDYAVDGGTLRVIGMSDLGQAQDADAGIYYDGCYQEDRDNYIDIIIAGDEAAARNIEAVEIPSLEGGYHAFYNPGGPGPEPTPGVRYAAPGPPDVEPVTIALDDEVRVDRDAVSQTPTVWMILLVVSLLTIVGWIITAVVRHFRR